MQRTELNDLVLTVGTTMDAEFDLGGDWDRLLASSNVGSVFLSSGWLRAWRETLGTDANLLVPRIHQRGELVATVALQHSNGLIEFAAAGPSDYSNFIVSRRLDPAAARRLIWILIRLAVERVPGFKCFRLSGIVVEEGATMAALREPDKGFFVTETGRLVAPWMDMDAGKRLKRKSRQRDRTLRKAGSLNVETFLTPDEILPQMDDFFGQHIRRWSSPETPSPFEDVQYRAFYRSVARNLGAAGTVRFTAARLDGRLIAAHFGFCFADRFFYYKPTFETDLSKLSPGTFLLEHLLHKAKDEPVSQFDFLKGAEPYKFRFATGSRSVVEMHITQSAMTAALTRAQLWARRSARTLRNFVVAIGPSHFSSTS